MQYIVSFLEGIITFISPCLLPMIPIYITYFAGNGEKSSRKILSGAFGFCIGFTAVFVSMGALAGVIGGFLTKYQTWVNIVCGLIVVFFGLNFMGVFKINLFKGSKRGGYGGKTGFISSMLFGIVFSLGWTPCVGAFLGSALMMASAEGQVIKGVLMLLCYSVGLGIPFMLSALLIESLKSAFNFIKRNYRIINIISGSLLIVVGLLMAFGLLNRLLF